MELWQVMQQRRSWRDFSDKSVPLSTVEELIGAAAAAPTSCNMQIHKFILINQADLLQEFAKHVTGKVNWTKQFFILLVDQEITFENQANYVSSGMAVQNLLLRAEDLGLVACPIAGFKGKNFIRKRLNIPERYDIPLLIFFGYPGGEKRPPMPFRLPVPQLMSVNRYQFGDWFPTSSKLIDWNHEQIIEYRRRIFSVYFPRWNHGVWRDGFKELWQYLMPASAWRGQKILALFVWDKGVFDSLKATEGELSVADYLPNYVDFLKSAHSADIKEALKVEELGQKSETFSRIVCAQNLMFHKNIEQILALLSRALKNDGEIVISLFNRYGLFALSYRLWQRSGRKAHVYHESSFYKIGPVAFYAKSDVHRWAQANQLVVTSVRGIATHATSVRVRNGLVGFLVKVWENIFPETLVYHLQKKN